MRRRVTSLEGSIASLGSRARASVELELATLNLKRPRKFMPHPN